MGDLPITPPVPAAVIDDLAAAVVPVSVAKAVTADIAKFDKNPLVAAVVHVAILLGMALYLKLPAKDVAVIGSLWSIGSAYFVSIISTLKAKA